MKKIIALLLSLSMFVGVFSGCETTLSNKNRDDDDDKIESEEISSKNESAESDESTELDENTEESENEDPAQPKDEEEQHQWLLCEFEDEFERPTGKKYIINSVSDGTFKNTKNSTKKFKLTATVQVLSNAIAIYLWEYGDELVGSGDSLSNVIIGNSSTEYNLTVLDSKDKKHYFTGCMEANEVYILIADEDKNPLFEILKQEGTVSFYLEENRNNGSTYLFTINADGFNEMYSQIQ